MPRGPPGPVPLSPAMLWPLPAVPVYGAHCLVQRALRTMYWTAATYFFYFMGRESFERSLVVAERSCWARTWRSPPG